jgi:hypothetical protein
MDIKKYLGRKVVFSESPRSLLQPYDKIIGYICNFKITNELEKKINFYLGENRYHCINHENIARWNNKSQWPTIQWEIINKNDKILQEVEK